MISENSAIFDAALVCKVHSNMAQDSRQHLKLRKYWAVAHELVLCTNAITCGIYAINVGEIGGVVTP